MNTFLKMALNNTWANSTLWEAVKPLSQAEFVAKRPGFFPSLHITMSHILEVDLYYIDAFEKGGEGRAVFFQDYPTDAASLADMQAKADARLASFCDQIDNAGLESMVPLERRDGVIRENTSDLLLHLFQHQIHHRGQAHVQLTDAGIAPPQLDDFYLIDGRVPSAAKYWT